MTETNIYALTVPGMYGKKNLVGVRNKLLLRSFGTLSAVIIYLSIRTTSKNIDLSVSFSRCKFKSVFYISRFASSKKIGFPIFHSEWLVSRLVPAMDCFKRM